MKNIALGYFDLGLFEEDPPKEPPLGKKEQDKAKRYRKRRKTIWTLALYLGVILGIVGQQFLNNVSNFSRLSLIASVILGTVIFPQVYKQASLNARKPNLMQLFVAFQNGFFWQNLMNVLTKLMEGT